MRGPGLAAAAAGALLSLAGVHMLSTAIAARLCEKRGQVVGEPVMRIYDIQDLLPYAKTWGGPLVFPGPVVLTAPVETIKREIAPGTWGGARGTTIVGNGGKLLVVHVAPVHAEIAAMLARKRETAREALEEADLRKKLKRKVTFEFVDTPLEEALAFLQTMTAVPIIQDPRAYAGGRDPRQPITLKLTDVRLNEALKWITRRVGLSYTLTHRAVLISTPK